MGFLNKLFPSENDRNVKKVKKIADKVQALEQDFKNMSDEELVAMTTKLKARLSSGETLDDILPEAFATVREAGWRVLKMRHFYVQLMGGIVLHQGRIAEMKTGEGKTLVATLPTYLNALEEKGVHVVTVNDYLAKRDAEWMGKIFRFLGLQVGVVVPGMTHEAKKAAYECDILYATNNELGFDYLRDNMATETDRKVQRPLNFAIVDEVDSILIDEARTPLIISGKGNKSSDLYQKANKFAKGLKPKVIVEEDRSKLSAKVKPEESFEGFDCIVEEKGKTARLTEEGIKKAERFFDVENLADLENSEINHHINSALKAMFIMKLDSDYIVADGEKGLEIIIIDEFTGRQMIGRRYSEGLHQAIEAKEGVTIREENKTLATITFQNYFRLYTKLSGMTGTAKTEEKEFKGIYKLDVVELPTNVPMQRRDENDQLYTTLKGKMNAILDDIEECYKNGQPVLCGTSSVDKSEELSALLKKRRVPHNILNAKNHQMEAEIVAQAGKAKQVTIATNMAGRGTDIMLGGNPEYLAKQKMASDGYKHEIIVAATGFAQTDDPDIIEAREVYAKLFAKFREQTNEEKEKVKELGGLRIIGTERHDSRRIDNQLRGRAGRQGDPGSSMFYLSLDDDIARIFGGDRLKSLTATLKVPDDMPIANKMFSNQIERAQKRVEDQHYSVRKRVLSYDDVMNKQREIIYGERNKVLAGEDMHEVVLSMIPDVVADIIGQFADYEVSVDQWDYKGFNYELEMVLFPPETNLVTQELAEKSDFDELTDTVTQKAVELYQKKAVAIDTHIKELSQGKLDFSEIERIVLLRYVDREWMDHIDAMDALRKGIWLRSLAQTDPVVAYTKEGFEMFDVMNFNIKKYTVRELLKREEFTFRRHQAAAGQAGHASDGSRPKKVKRQPVRREDKTGPNDPCICHSGKKYKYCCGN